MHKIYVNDNWIKYGSWFCLHWDWVSSAKKWSQYFSVVRGASILARQMSSGLISWSMMMGHKGRNLNMTTLKPLLKYSTHDNDSKEDGYGRWCDAPVALTVLMSSLLRNALIGDRIFFVKADHDTSWFCVKSHSIPLHLCVNSIWPFERKCLLEGFVQNKSPESGWNGRDSRK